MFHHTDASLVPVSRDAGILNYALSDSRDDLADTVIHGTSRTITQGSLNTLKGNTIVPGIFLFMDPLDVHLALNVGEDYLD